MKIYASLDALVAAIKRDELPARLISPGDAARTLGITRQGVYDHCRRGTLPCWRADRVILIDADAVEARAREGDRYAVG